LRHAAATRLSVRLTLERGVLVLEVADDGRGFDVNEKSASGNSSGLPGMRERAALLGADLRIHSAPREGTKLRLSLALRRIRLPFEGRRGGRAGNRHPLGRARQDLSQPEHF